MIVVFRFSYNITILSMRNSENYLENWSGQNRTGRTACYGHAFEVGATLYMYSCAVVRVHLFVYTAELQYPYLGSHSVYYMAKVCLRNTRHKDPRAKREASAQARREKSQLMQM